MTTFIKALGNATIERQVEDAYNEMFKSLFPKIEFSYPFQCDGYFEIKSGEKTYRCIVEYKFDCDYTNRIEMTKTALQILFYIKKFENNGRLLPNVCIVADRNEAFVFHANVLLKYLDFDGVDWNKAPSSASFVSPELLMALNEDKDFNPFVFRTNEWFNVEDLKNKILDLATNTQRLVHITEHNIDKIFNVFADRVVIDKKKISPNDLVGLFFGCICDKENYYLHPGKNNTLVSPLGNFCVDAKKFNAFFSYFSNEISPKEKLRLAAISDRLIEDTNRRRKGEFYTPTPFVDYSHKMISEALGENWKDEYVVWDCCCGTKNLTRDYKFKELYCSTLEQAELDIAKNYNDESYAYQFDFLNDEFKQITNGGKVPDGLIEAFEQNKKICFMLNPPYGAMGGLHKDGKVNKGIEQTKIYDEMCKLQIKGAASSNLYTQFLFRISKLKEKYNLSNCIIAIFCPPSYVTGQKYKDFRKYFYSNFEYIHGMQFDSTHFTDVAFGAIMFSIWKNGKTINDDLKTDIVDINDNDDLIIIDSKTLMNSIGKNPLNKWFREKDRNQVEAPNLKTGITIVEGNVRSCKNAIGYMFANGNNIFQAPQRTVLYSITSGYGHGTNIFESNFDKCVTSFAARLICDKNAYNQFDEFMAPNTNNPNWQQFVNDSVVYSLFNGKSQQSSLRNIEYHNKTWDIKNEFFWMSKSEIEDLANENGLDDLYSDARTSSERFVFNKLQTLELSPEAKAVLDKANELVRKSFKYRKLFDEMHPEYQLTKAWDAGWYQIKGMLKEFMPNELKEFKDLFKALADKMRPQIYELGFLKK